VEARESVPEETTPADPFSDLPPNDPRYRAEWLRWFNLLTRHYSELGQLRTEGEWVGHLYEKDWDGVTWWFHHPSCLALQLSHGRACCLWHERYGARIDPSICAGCGTEIDGQPFGLPDGCAVHADDGFTCLKLYGTRWRHAAADALAALGIAIDGEPAAPDAPPGMELPY